MLDRSMEEEVKRVSFVKDLHVTCQTTPTPAYQPSTNDYFKIGDFSNSDDA
jgi:hypothetical protein